MNALKILVIVTSICFCLIKGKLNFLSPSQLCSTEYHIIQCFSTPSKLFPWISVRRSLSYKPSYPDWPSYPNLASLHLLPLKNLRWQTESMSNTPNRNLSVKRPVSLLEQATQFIRKYSGNSAVSTQSQSGETPRFCLQDYAGMNRTTAKDYKWRITQQLWAYFTDQNRPRNEGNITHSSLKEKLGLHKFSAWQIKIKWKYPAELLRSNFRRLA